MKRSDCCGAEKYGDYDICLDCKEHADFWDDEEQGSNLENPDYNLDHMFDYPMDQLEDLSNIVNKISRKKENK